MKKEESKVIAQKFQKIPNGTLALKHCRAGGTGTTLFGEQFRAVTAGKGVMEAYETFPGIEVSFNVMINWLMNDGIIRRIACGRITFAMAFL